MNVLCRHGYHLFPYSRIKVRCTSDRCSEVRDTEGRRGPRRLLPNREDLWARGQQGRRLDLAQPCPHCRENGRMVPACPVCWNTLDREAGLMDDALIAVLGARQAGKSHFFAALLHLLLRQDVGNEVWKVKIERSMRRQAERQLLQPLFKDLEELPATPLGSALELKLVLENQENRRRVLLVFQDLAGETMAERRRLEQADFLRYASGVVLLADPLAFEPPKKGLRRQWQHHQEPDCVEILELYRDVLETAPFREGQEDLPLLPEQKFLAVAVTKADLVLHRGHRFWVPSTNGAHLKAGYWESRREYSATARDWLLGQLDEPYRFREAARVFSDVSYFFVSSYGYAHKPQTETLRKPPEPLRVHEPIFALLDRLTAGGAVSTPVPRSASRETVNPKPMTSPPPAKTTPQQDEEDVL